MSHFTSGRGLNLLGGFFLLLGVGCTVTDRLPGEDTVPVCSNVGASLATTDPARRLLPWKLNLASGTGGAGASSTVNGPCGSTSFYPAKDSCEGTATVQTVNNALALLFADGSTLVWDASLVTNPVSPPKVSNGGTVWVSYTKHNETIPFGGDYFNEELTIRATEGGQILWVGRDGQRQSNIDAVLVSELFGVAAEEQIACKVDFGAACSDVTRVDYNHLLKTSPEQLLPHATLTQVATPNGNYDVVWAQSKETSTTPNCIDGPGVASDTGFAASRL